MINGKMWLVVNPTVGIPLIIGGVALTSLAIHLAVLTNTTWYPAFYQGGTSIRPRPAAEIAPATPPPALAAVQLAPSLTKEAR